jgi:L-amino acid N-acyltransferase YncA
MASFRARRAIVHDVESLQKLCVEARGNRSTLLGVRPDTLDPAAWLNALAPVVIAEEAGKPVAFAAAAPWPVPLGASRCAELVVYVTSARRRCGAARSAFGELISVCRVMGLWKLVAYALPEDAAARGLLGRLDFREVGVMAKHVQIEGSWRDVVMQERLVMASRRSAPSIPDA